ncbi:transglycosylase SLT domain-containing protein [Aquihabitans sp. G128]|uniref:lytic transglycosylase domain-containing protein n=1 Tax=Aquihabitans sp. G128 TaxID=2849779 RepID=UPI001C21407F|nr:transglycosylase SLT domain-containing protein [Aquihabitans sp. G128]QXC61946.1 transglycosylase SLT domain-containing protein [Aquihabitans sp. G128]
MLHRPSRSRSRTARPSRPVRAARTRRVGAAAALAGLLAVPVLVTVRPVDAAPPPGEHRIRAGETLSGLAAELGTSVEALAAANGVRDPNHIVAGRTLRVPATASTAATGGVPAFVKASRRHLGPVFDRWAQANGVSPSLLKAMCFNESGWQADVVSSTGADGVCQLMPNTEDHMEALIGRELDSSDAEDNIRLGARYLRWLLARTDGDVREAVGGYYQGLASIRRDGPLDETDAYVDTVLALQRRFRAAA